MSGRSGKHNPAFLLQQPFNLSIPAMGPIYIHIYAAPINFPFIGLIASAYLIIFRLIFAWVRRINDWELRR